MVTRGGVYKVDLGQSGRGHEQRGKRFGVVISDGVESWSVATIVPTSTSAQPAVFRPEIEVLGVVTRLLVDQIRTIDLDYVGEWVGMLSYAQMTELNGIIANFLGLLGPTS